MLEHKKGRPNIDDDPNCTHMEGKMHNCSYVDLRNSFIREAIKITHENVNRERNPSSWDQFFFKTMDKLVKKTLEK